MDSGARSRVDLLLKLDSLAGDTSGVTASHTNHRFPFHSLAAALFGELFDSEASPAPSWLVGNTEFRFSMSACLWDVIYFPKGMTAFRF